MWTVDRPDFDVEETFRCCIGRVRSRELHERLESVTNDIVNAASKYAVHAAQQKLHQFPHEDNVAGIVTRDEMIATYDQRMAAKTAPGRMIYDAIKLLPENDTCPFCDHGVVSTLDHVLPKTVYPVLTVTPDNLVGCCSDCNKVKSNVTPQTARDATIHPYFDNVTNKPWLEACIIEGAVAAVIFRTVPQEAWTHELNTRVANQFRLFKLGELYSKQAARLISGNRKIIIEFYSNGGASSVKAELIRQYKSWRSYRLNCWQTATFLALSKSIWYCEEGCRL